MSKGRNWPSRRLQIGIILALAAGALAQAFWKPIDRHAKAEKLYHEALFMASKGKGNSTSMIEVALELEPGNTLYEQALVFMCNNSEDKLSNLLKTQKLGPEAQKLAAGLMYGMKKPSYSDKSAQTAAKDLELLIDLQKADPENSLVHYRKAMAYRKLDRIDDVISEVRIANRLGAIDLYIPRVSKDVQDSLYGTALFSSVFFDDTASMRDLARTLRNTANDRLRHGKVDEAENILEDCARMGANFASAEPCDTIQWLVGSAMFKIAAADLEPTYREFGQTDKIAALKEINDAYEQGTKEVSSSISRPLDDLLIATAKSYSIPMLLVGLAVAAFWISLSARLTSIGEDFQRKRRSEPAMTIQPWSTGWLARMFVVVYIPIIALWSALVWNFPQQISKGMSLGLTEASFPDVLAATALLSQLAVVILTLRMLRHSHDTAANERTGLFKFIFRSPAAAKAWTSKYLAAAMLGQLLFLACLGLLTIILYKPIMGGHPWEIEKYKVYTMSKDQAVIGRIAEDLKKASAGL